MTRNEVKNLLSSKRVSPFIIANTLAGCSFTDYRIGIEVKKISDDNYEVKDLK